MPAKKFEYDQIVWDHREEIVEQTERLIDDYHTMRVTMFEWGWVIETRCVDEDYTTTLETLVSYDGYTATITHRARYGPFYDGTETYVRDSFLPIPSIVRLRP
jgi:hypothetical protein